MRYALCLPLLLSLSPVMASEMCTEDAMIVFDGSGSMAEMGFNDIDEPRIFEARRALHQSLPAIGQARRLGLIIYGPGGDSGCGNVDVRFAPEWQAAPRILDQIDQLEPDGDTPPDRSGGAGSADLELHPTSRGHCFGD